LASGSLPKFWQLAQVAEPPKSISELVPEKSRCKAIHAEQDRIKYFTHQTSLDLSGLVQFILSKQGPRLVIMNTVQSAAVVADELHSNYGQEVLHLSTALCPIDRDKIIEQVESRLDDKLHTDWTLVATSCVEAGMDFSFSTAFRESCSVSSLIQIGGRVNRHGDGPISEIWDFRIDVDEALLNQHPAFAISRMVLADLFSEDKMNRLPSAELATEAMRREIMTDYDKRAGAIKDREKKCDYPEVAKLCRVIDADTRIVVISGSIIQALEERRTKIDRRELLRHSVQLWSKKIKDLALEPIFTYPELYKMPDDQYGAFNKDQPEPCFGYMKGILPLVYASRDGLII
jgi:CRISPR-associated endonuclease/helicase Cas3